MFVCLLLLSLHSPCRCLPWFLKKFLGFSTQLLKFAFITVMIIASLDFISSVQYMIHYIYHFVRRLASFKKDFQLTGTILKYELLHIIKDQPAWFWRCPPCGSRNLWQVSFSVKPHFSPGVLSAAHTLFECPHPHRQNQAGKKKTS